MLKNFPQILEVLKLLQTSNDKISARYSKLLPKYPEESLTEFHYGGNQNFWNFSEHQRQIFKPEKKPTRKVFKTQFYQSRANLLLFFLKYFRTFCFFSDFGQKLPDFGKIFQLHRHFLIYRIRDFSKEKSKKVKFFAAFWEKIPWNCSKAF